MPDYVCYSASKSALVGEAKSSRPNWVNVDDELRADMTPLITKVTNGKTELMSVMRVADIDEINTMANLVVIGEYVDGAFVPVSQAAQAKYSRLYATLKPVTATLPDGSTGASSVPEVIGAIA